MVYNILWESPKVCREILVYIMIKKSLWKLISEFHSNVGTYRSTVKTSLKRRSILCFVGKDKSLEKPKALTPVH